MKVISFERRGHEIMFGTSHMLMGVTGGAQLTFKDSVSLSQQCYTLCSTDVVVIHTYI